MSEGIDCNKDTLFKMVPELQHYTVTGCDQNTEIAQRQCRSPPLQHGVEPTFVDAIDRCVGWMVHVTITNVSVSRSQQLGETLHGKQVVLQVAIEANPLMITTKSIRGSVFLAQRCNGSFNRFMQRESF